MAMVVIGLDDKLNALGASDGQHWRRLSKCSTNGMTAFNLRTVFTPRGYTLNTLVTTRVHGVAVHIARGYAGAPGLQQSDKLKGKRT